MTKWRAKIFSDFLRWTVDEIGGACHITDMTHHQQPVRSMSQRGGGFVSSGSSDGLQGSVIFSPLSPDACLRRKEVKHDGR
jgi:hypothetical protein